MSYTPINWQTGQTITADKLNKMDNGWGVETSGGELFSETVATVIDPDFPEDGARGSLSYATLITADILTITFDGVDYECQKIEGYAYGGWSNGTADFTNYPFALLSSEFMGMINNDVITATEGTYTISVSSISKTIETSAEFATAVSSVVDLSTLPMLCVSGVTTYSEMSKAIDGGRILYFKPFEQGKTIKFITSFDSATVVYMPTASSITASFNNDGIFTVTVQM